MQTKAKVVVAYLDGRRIKGFTNDFSPVRDQFFLFPEHADPKPGERGTPVKMADLKAVFFVRSFEGDPVHKDDPTAVAAQGKKVQITFTDGEVQTGNTVAYNQKNLGFFMTPGDPQSNNERIFVINRNVKSAKVL